MEEKIIVGIEKRGYGCIINDGVITTSKDGFTSITSLENVYNLMDDPFLSGNPLGLDDVVDFIITIHSSRKDIDDGVYDDEDPLSIIYSEEPLPTMDSFDMTLKMLYESTDDVKIRESIQVVQGYKTLYLDTPKS